MRTGVSVIIRYGNSAQKIGIGLINGTDDGSGNTGRGLGGGKGDGGCSRPVADGNDTTAGCCRVIVVGSNLAGKLRSNNIDRIATEGRVVECRSTDIRAVGRTVHSRDACKIESAIGSRICNIGVIYCHNVNSGNRPDGIKYNGFRISSGNEKVVVIADLHPIVGAIDHHIVNIAHRHIITIGEINSAFLRLHFTCRLKGSRPVVGDPAQNLGLENLGGGHVVDSKSRVGSLGGQGQLKVCGIGPDIQTFTRLNQGLQLGQNRRP